MLKRNELIFLVESMAPPTWASVDQTAFLESRLDEYLEAKKSKTLQRFWIRLDHDWFLKWPEEGQDAPPMETDDARELHVVACGKRLDIMKKVI